MKYLITSALPYTHGVPHLGNITGSILPADVYYKYIKYLAGKECIYICGSDEHGTALEIQAIKEGVPVEELADKFHKIVKESLEDFEFEFTHYGRTHSKYNKERTYDIFHKLRKNGHIFEKETTQAYCPKDKRFLPDRWVEGECPKCGGLARGDQCDSCGALLDPEDLINPRCKICNSKVEFRKTKHLFIRLGDFEERLKNFIKERHFSKNAEHESLSWIKEGLPSRCITRDTSWGFPVPLEGYEGKVFYVWFDAPIGYISITEEYFDQKGEYEKWKDYWLNPKDTVLVQFMGKDNILFHTIIFPAMLMGTGDDYVLVNKLVSYNWLNAKGIKFSKSRGVGLNIRNALEILPADYWRFALISLLPEKSDTEFSIEVMMEKVNKELVGNFSNYIYRVLNMAYKKGYLKNNEYDEEYKEAMEIYNEIMESYEKIELRDALLGILKLSQYGNQLLNKYEPWKWKDREKVGKFIYLHLKIIHLLAKASFPIITKSAKDIFLMLGLAPFEEGEFNVKRPKILFRKLGDEFLEKLKSTIKYGKEGKEEEFSVKV